MDRPRLCLIGDRLVRETDAQVAATDRGFLYADGLFETLRTYGGRPFRLAEHWQRLSHSAAFLGIGMPAVEPVPLIGELLAANRLADAAVRITLSRGTEPRGPAPHVTPAGTPTLLVQARPLRRELPSEARAGVAGQFVAEALRARGLALQHHKTLAYLGSVLALGRARPGTEPLLVNTDGDVAEGATTNVFWARDGRLFTPSPEAGCLPGLARACVLELAATLGYPIAEGCYPAVDLAGADEGFLTNSVIEVVPLVRLGEAPLGSGAPGPMTRALQAAYRDRVRAETGVP